jgi:hypothetical protein
MYSNFLLESILYEENPTTTTEKNKENGDDGGGNPNKKVEKINEITEHLRSLLIPLEKGVLSGTAKNFESTIDLVRNNADKILKFRIGKTEDKAQKASLQNLRQYLSVTLDIEALRKAAEDAYIENNKSIKKLNEVLEAAFEGNKMYGPATSALIGKISKLANALVEITSELKVANDKKLNKKEMISVKQAKKIIYNGFVKPYLDSLEDDKGAESVKNAGINWKKISLIIVLYILGAILIYFSLKMSGVTVTGFASILNAVEEVLSHNFTSALLFLLGVALVGYGLYLTFKPLIVKLINKIRAWWNKNKKE